MNLYFKTKIKGSVKTLLSEVGRRVVEEKIKEEVKDQIKDQVSSSDIVQKLKHFAVQSTGVLGQATLAIASVSVVAVGATVVNRAVSPSPKPPTVASVAVPAPVPVPVPLPLPLPLPLPVPVPVPEPLPLPVPVPVPTVSVSSSGGGSSLNARLKHFRLIRIAEAATGDEGTIQYSNGIFDNDIGMNHSIGSEDFRYNPLSKIFSVYQASTSVLTIGSINVLSSLQSIESLNATQDTSINSLSNDLASTTNALYFTQAKLALAETQITPVGTVSCIFTHLSGVTVPSNWMLVSGGTVSDADSPINGASLPDLNGSGRYIRGGGTAGTEQEQSVPSLGTYMTDFTFSNVSISDGAFGTNYSVVRGSTISNVTSVASLGDATEVRPKSITCTYYIKIK